MSCPHALHLGERGGRQALRLARMALDMELSDGMGYGSKAGKTICVAVH